MLNNTDYWVVQLKQSKRDAIFNGINEKNIKDINGGVWQRIFKDKIAKYACTLFELWELPITDWQINKEASL